MFFLLEMALYAIFVTCYFLLVLLFLGDKLLHLFQTNKVTYAFVALALMVGQGALMDVVTSTLLGFFRRRLHPS
jgi:hypothetical protein